MPTGREIESALYDFAPPELKMDWDNVGFLLGDPDKPVKRVLVALDITETVAREAASLGAELIVAHHPLMNCKWLPVQTVRRDTPQGRLLMALLENGISAICMHTNLDAAPGGVNDALAAALRVNDPGPLTEESIGRVGMLASPMALADFVPRVKEALGANGVRFADAGKPVYKVAVGGGACADFVEQAIALGCDTFVTSDVSYHQFLDAPAKGINLIDAGHFPTENVVCPVIVQMLKKAFPQLEIDLSASHREVIQYYV